MSSKKKHIICVTGPDGSGKSTLIKGLTEVFPNSIECSIWDALEQSSVQLFASKQEVDAYLCQLTPNSRTLFLAHALQFAIDHALGSTADIVFINAYYYKYFANEIAMGATQTLIASLIEEFPAEDLTFYLNLPVEQCTERKPRFSSYECGCRPPSISNFEAFQNKTQHILKGWIRSDWHHLDATDSPETLIKRATELIKQNL